MIVRLRARARADLREIAAYSAERHGESAAAEYLRAIDAALLRLCDYPEPGEAYAERAELERLAAKPDAEIDTSDIPPLDERFWANAIRFRDRALYRPVKRSTTVRLDADVLQ